MPDNKYNNDSIVHQFHSCHLHIDIGVERYSEIATDIDGLNPTEVDKESFVGEGVVRVYWDCVTKDVLLSIGIRLQHYNLDGA